MKTTFQFGLPCKIAGLLLLLYCLSAPDGRAADLVAPPPGGSPSETIISEARLSLAEARKTQSDPKTTVGHYLDAADAAVRSVSGSSGNEAEARSIYNAASQEVVVLLRSSAELWNRTETIPSRDGIYRLRFVAGSKKEVPGIQVISTSFVPLSKYTKRSLTRRRGLTIGAECWWESTSQRTLGRTFCPSLAWPSR
jgi:hypothetical protein